MRTSRFQTFLAILFCLMTGFSSKASASGWSQIAQSQDTKNALALLAAVAVQREVSPLHPFEFQCPAFSLPENLNYGKNKEFSNALNDFANRFLPILAGKSVELIQGDLCRLYGNFRGYQGEEVDAFCDNLQNLPLSKATAKSVGKMAKTMQSKKSGFSLATAGVSTYGAMKLADYLACRSYSAHSLALMTSLSMILDYYSSPQALAQLGGAPVSDTYAALDHWLTRPFFHRILTTGTRYGLEKQFQSHFMNTQFPMQLGSFFKHYLKMSPRATAIMTKAGAIGSSKVLSGALAASILSASELALDAMSSNPEFKSVYERLEKLCSDVGIALGTNALISVALPSVLLAARPHRILTLFILVNAALVAPQLAAYLPRSN